jgi:hypothetical protein
MNTPQSIRLPGANDLCRMAITLDWRGDSRADAAYPLAADMGDCLAMTSLMSLREKAGDEAGVTRICRQAADRGCATRRGESMAVEARATELWPFGLEADGTASAPWSAK